MATKCGWTPFHDMTVKGFPIGTIINGKTVMHDGKVITEGSGQPLEF
jgi:dihydroorotase